MQKAKFVITGMTCSSCSAHIDKAVNRLNGVKDVSVNLLSNSMTLLFDENVISPAEIIKVVTDCGYGATLIEGNQKEHNSQMDTQQDGRKEMKKRLQFSFIFLLLLMIVSMHHMILDWLHITPPAWLLALFDGNENAITFALTQFLLLLPILYWNRNYFITGFKRLSKLSPNMDSLIAIR